MYLSLALGTAKFKQLDQRRSQELGLGGQTKYPNAKYVATARSVVFLFAPPKLTINEITGVE